MESPTQLQETATTKRARSKSSGLIDARCSDFVVGEILEVKYEGKWFPAKLVKFDYTLSTPFGVLYQKLAGAHGWGRNVQYHSRAEIRRNQELTTLPTSRTSNLPTPVDCNRSTAESVEDTLGLGLTRQDSQIACLARDVANKQDEQAGQQLAALIESGALVSVQGWALMKKGKRREVVESLLLKKHWAIENATPELMGLFRPQLQSLALNSFGYLHEAKLDARGLRDSDVRCLWSSTCVGLHCVNLSGNRLRTLPEELGLLTNLQVLDVSSNRLYEVHSTVADLLSRSLHVLRLDRNPDLRIPPAHVTEQGSQAIKHYYASMKNGQQLRTFRSVSLVGRHKRALLKALQWGSPQVEAADADSEQVGVHTTEWLTTSAINSEGKLPLEVQIRVPGTVGVQYQGRIQDFGKMRQSFVRVDGNRLRIQNGEKDFDVLLDQSVTLRCMEKDGDALLELHNVCKPPKAFSRIMSARMSLRLHFTSVQNRDCWFTVLKLANTIPQPCQHWYSGEWREESVVFRSKVTDGRSGTWLEVLTRNKWPGEGAKAASDHSLHSLVLEPMRVDTSQSVAPYLERDAGMQIICCQVHVSSDVVCAGGQRISSEGRVKLLLRETASSPMPQWNLLRLAIHECVGAEADATAMQMFLVRQHAMMLVCDATTLKEDPCIERVCWWVKRAKKHTHHRRVFLVATCEDEFSESDRKCAQSKLIDALKRPENAVPLNNEEDEETEDEKKDDERANEGLEGDRIFFVNLHSLDGVDTLREAMYKLLPQVVQKNVESTVPCRYACLGDLVDSLRERQAVISFAELAELACRRLGFTRLQESVSTTGAPREWTGKSDMEMALELLHQRGEVFWFHKPAKLHDWVFLIPSFVANLVRYVWQPAKPVGALRDRGVLQMDMLPTLWGAQREVYVIGCAVLAELLVEFRILEHSLHHASAMGEDAHKQQNQSNGLLAGAVKSDVVTKDLDEEDSTSFTDDLPTTPVFESRTHAHTPGVSDNGISQTTGARVERASSPRNVPIPFSPVHEFAPSQHEQCGTSLAGTQTSSTPSGNPESPATESLDDVDGVSESNEVADDEGSAKVTVSTPATPCNRGERSSAADVPATYNTEPVSAQVKSRFWFMGSNDHGQFGLGHCRDLPALVSAAESMEEYVRWPVGVTKIALGRRHALFITTDCCVFGMGGNDFGQLGLGDISRELVLDPRRVEGLRADPRHLLCCGDDTSLVVGHDAVYAAGRSQHGVLGVGPVARTEVSRFRAVVGLPAPSCVHRVSAGAQHCAVLARSSNGQFRVWGCGDAPFLGDDDAKIRQNISETASETPSGESAEREGTQNDEDIAETTDCDNDGIDDACEAGLTAADRVRMAATRWAERGDNASKSRRSLASMRADISPLLEGIDLGEHEDILQDTLSAWQHQSHLGGPLRWRPQGGISVCFRVAHFNGVEPNDIVDVTCGLDHTVLRCRGGEVWVSGYNRCGQLGLGRDTSFVGSFMRVDCPPVQHVSAGARYTLMVSRFMLLGAGVNSARQLGQPTGVTCWNDPDLEWEFSAWDAPKLDGSSLRSVYAAAGRSFIFTGKGELLASESADSSKWSRSLGVFKSQMSFDTPSGCEFVVGCLSPSIIAISPEKMRIACGESTQMLVPRLIRQPQTLRSQEWHHWHRAPLEGERMMAIRFRANMHWSDVIDCESAVVAGLMDVLNRGSYLHTRISQDGVLARCPGGIQVFAVAHRGCSEVEAERTLVLKESSSKRTLRSSPTASMAKLRSKSRSPTSSTANPSEEEADSGADLDSCLQSLVIDVCVRGPWERGSPNQVHNSDLKGLTCEMLCQQLTAKGFPEFAARFAEDGVDGDCVVGLKPSQQRVLERLCLGVHSKRSVSELLQVIQEYRLDGVTYGVQWQTNPLLPLATALLPFADATRTVLRKQGKTLLQSWQQILSPSLLLVNGLYIDLHAPKSRRRNDSTKSGFALKTSALSCRQSKSTVHCPRDQKDIDHSEIFPVEQLWASSTAHPGTMVSQTPSQAGWVWPEPTSLRRAILHTAAHHKSQAARGKLFDTFQKHLGKEFHETDLEIILHFMRHRARLLIPFNAVTELASFVSDPAARRRNMFERAADNSSKTEKPTLGMGDLVVRVRASNKLVVKGDMHEVVRRQSSVGDSPSQLSGVERVPIKAVPRMSKVWSLQADADETSHKPLPAPGEFGSTWHLLDEREKRRYTEQRVFGAAYGNAVLSDKAVHYLDVLRPKYGELGLTFPRGADNSECKRSYLVLASHVRKYCTMMTVGTGKRKTEWERAGTLASCCHVLLALFEASGGQIKEVMQSVLDEAMAHTQSTKDTNKNTPKPSSTSANTISGGSPVVEWQHRPLTEASDPDCDWEAYPTSEVDLLEAAWSRKGTVQLGDARTVDLDTMTQSTSSGSGAKLREVRRVVESRQSATVAELLNTAFADAVRRPFVEVHIHSPVRFEQDVEFMAVHEAALEQPGVMEQVEAFTQRYHIAVKRVDSAGVLSPLRYAPFTTPRAHIDAARRQHERSNMATRQRTRSGSVVTDVPSHWSMVKPGIRRVDVTETQWKGVLMRDHFQQFVDSSIDQKQVSLRNTIGKGRDTQWRSTGFTYNELVVEKVYRIEHTERWRMFRNRRQKLRDCASHMHSVTPHVPTYLEGNMDWLCDPNDPLDHSVNEAYLFHGTKPSTVPVILKTGLDEHYSQDVGLFGRGLYLAAAASKSNQYCMPDLDEDRSRNPHFGLYPMFVVRTCLGPCLGTPQRPVVPRMLPRMLQKMTLGTAIVSAQAVAARLLPKGTAVRGDEVSVIGHGIGANDGQEYVVYYGDQCYVEYLLYFSRKDSDNLDSQEF